MAGSVLAGWDYATQVTFELQPSVVEDLFLSFTGQRTLWDCDVVAMVDCPSTGFRYSTRRAVAELVTGTEKVLAVRPSLGTIADRVQLSAHVIVAKDGPPRGDSVAHTRGARLASSPRHNLTLEGTGARFPTDAVPFSQLRWPNALWAVHADFSDPEEPFNSGVRLFINTEHPRSDALVDTSHPENPLLQSALETDLVRQLLRAAAETDRFGKAARGWPDGSIGSALESMADLFFGNSVGKLIALEKSDPAAFDRLLQARMNLFGGTR